MVFILTDEYNLLYSKKGKRYYLIFKSKKCEIIFYISNIYSLVYVKTFSVIKYNFSKNMITDFFAILNSMN